MRTIEYFGQTYELPEDIKYLAVDGDGEVWGYPDEPYITTCGEMFDLSTESGQAHHLGNTKLCEDWKSSLVCLDDTLTTSFKVAPRFSDEVVVFGKYKVEVPIFAAYVEKTDDGELYAWDCLEMDKVYLGKVESTGDREYEEL